MQFASLVCSELFQVLVLKGASQTRLEQCDHLIWIGLAGMTGWAGLGLLD